VCPTAHINVICPGSAAAVSCLCSHQTGLFLSHDADENGRGAGVISFGDFTSIVINSRMVTKYFRQAYQRELVVAFIIVNAD